MTYEIKITPAKESTKSINLISTNEDSQSGMTANAISNVEFKVDSIEEDLKDRSGNVRVMLKIEGQISEETSEMCNAMLEWSKLGSSEDVYRKVILTIKTTAGKLLRKYIIPLMFVEDYFEKYDSENTGMYTLKLIQQKGHLKDIETECTSQE